MEIYAFTNDLVFNTMFTIFVNISILVVPLFAAISLFRN